MVFFAGGKFRDYVPKMLHTVFIINICLHGVIFTQGNFHDKCTQSQKAHIKISCLQ